MLNNMGTQDVDFLREIFNRHVLEYLQPGLGKHGAILCFAPDWKKPEQH